MLLAALLCFSCGLTTALTRIKQEHDLEIGSSNNHYSYQRQYQHFDERTPSHYRQDISYPGMDKSHEQFDMSYPVKTVQRYTDSDGNVKVITSYGSRDENPATIYKNENLNMFSPSKKKAGYQGNYQETHPPNFYPHVTVVTPKSLPFKQEYSQRKTIRFPGNEGELITEEQQTKTKDGNSSAYNQHTSYTSRYNKPELGISKGHNRTPKYSGDKEVTQPLQGASSSYSSDIDDGLDDESPGSYSGSRGYHSSHEHHGYGGRLNPYIPRGPIIPHGPHGGGFGKEGGKSYSYNQQEEKGHNGGKGHKSHEAYHKGHSEKHGHEENKGGQQEESGEKSGHHNENNHFADGHTASSGSKFTEKEQVKGHKKGHKTKGFRTVHHKDEYKKDEIFYDEELDAGNHKNQGHDETSHKHEEGGKTKKSHLNSGYKDVQYGFHGDKEEGHSYEDSRGHEGHEGHSGQNGHHSYYSNGSGHKKGEAHGHGGQGYF